MTQFVQQRETQPPWQISTLAGCSSRMVNILSQSGTVGIRLQRIGQMVPK